MTQPSRSTLRAALSAVVRRRETATLGTMILHDAVQDLYRALYRLHTYSRDVAADPADLMPVISAGGIGRGVLRGNTIHMVETPPDFGAPPTNSDQDDPRKDR